MNPQISYRIWFSQRYGSTLLCKGLAQTGIMGNPVELFNLSEGETLSSTYGVKTYEELRRKLWRIGSGANGVFGMKQSMYGANMKKLTQELIKLKGLNEHQPLEPEELFAGIFPNCKHIFMTRRNKVRQAVSWWKAINDQHWHLKKGTNFQESVGFYEQRYNFDAINHLFKEASLRECAIQAYFTQHHTTPLTIVYEDFIQNYEATIREVIEFVGVRSENVKIDEPYYQPTATPGSEMWVQRFRKELQENMGIDIW
ncbi:MAG: Stf0 family sulfotransferase [Bacteroidota bacterium]